MAQRSRPILLSRQAQASSATMLAANTNLNILVVLIAVLRLSYSLKRPLNCSCLFHCFPGGDVAGLGAEYNAELYHRARVAGKLTGIILLLNLL